MILELKYLVLFAALALASFQDVRTREIEDKIWLVAGAIGAALTVFEAITVPGFQLVLALVSIGLTALVAFGIYFLGLYGGADAKALLVIAVTVPLVPVVALTSSPFFPMTVLGNALLFSLILVPVCFLYNIIWKASKRKSLFSAVYAKPLTRFGALFTGIKVKPKTAKLVHFNVLEVYAEGAPTTLRLFSKVSDEDEVKVIDEGAEYVWVTPAIPMIVFFLAGFALATLGVDLLFGILFAIL